MTTFFDGAPSLASALPYALEMACIGGLVAGAAAIGFASGVVMAWGLAEAFFLVLAISLARELVRIAVCRIEIDDARIRVSSGIVVREVCSLELFRIQNVWSVCRWWQQIFGIGDLVIETSDPRHPVWRLTGLPDPELLRDALNAAAVELRSARGIGEVNLGAI